jgi:hypothetical protein
VTVAGDPNDPYHLYFYDDGGRGSITLSREKAGEVKSILMEKGYLRNNQIFIQRIEGTYDITRVEDKDLIEVIIDCFQKGGILKVVEPDTSAEVALFYYNKNLNKLVMVNQEGEHKLIDV